MSNITQRSLYFINPLANAEQVFRDISQNEQVITIPANSSLPLSLQEKINVPYDKLKHNELVELLIKSQLVDIRYNEKTENSKDLRLGQTIFNDFKNLNGFGLDIQVAPQQVSSFKEYQQTSKDLINKILGSLKSKEQIKEDEKPIFYNNEWFKYHSFNGHTDIEVTLLRLWNSISYRELPIHLSNLKNLSSFEIYLENDQNQLSLVLYWDKIIKPLKISKGYKSEIIKEIGAFQSMSPEPWEYEPALSGVTFKLPSTEDPVLLRPTFLISYPIHNTLYGFSSKHEILQKSSLHPIYKIGVIQNGKEDNPYLSFKPHLEQQCSLKFDIDFSKDIIIDRYQLAGKPQFKDLKIFNEDEMDLELPTYKLNSVGSSLSLTLNDSYVLENSGFEIPLHLRYGEPNSNGVEDVLLSKGDLYWECSTRDYDEKKLTKISDYFLNDNKNKLGYERIQDNLKLYYIGDIENSNYFQLAMPVGELQNTFLVELVTLLGVIFSTLYIVKKMFL